MVLWLILLLPLAASICITFFTLKNQSLSAKLSISAIVTSFLLSLKLLASHQGPDNPVISVVSWLSVGGLEVPLNLTADSLSIAMLLVVTGVGSAIHFYSAGYMKGDPSYSRYFASLSFFTFSMLGIVLSGNFVQMFIFWELVGVSSYLLIGFWFKRPAAADACKKAFITNRIGDFGFLSGILLVWVFSGSVQFSEIQQSVAADPGLFGQWATLIGILIFCGAIGKSAQFPLHVWLPDAMEGPTPVSALIHAATMVAAGIFMLCRTAFIFDATPALPEVIAWASFFSASDFIAWTGGITALMAAMIAVQQNDIKRILAYSTLSQLGYMVMAVGLGGQGAAMYHLTTHAFFKALLFLWAGSVITAMHHEQNIWKMGGLSKRTPVTYITFLLGTLALCGIPPFSGFYSKDEILTIAYHENQILFGIGVLAAALTTFYMFRLLLVVFFGKPKSDEAAHAQESSSAMTAPLIFLSIPTVLAGIWGIGSFFDELFGGAHVQETLPFYKLILMPFHHAPMAAFSGLGAVLFGFAASFELYRRAEQDPIAHHLPAISGVLQKRFYLDELYQNIIRCTQDALAFLADIVDRWIIAGLCVRGVHGTVEFIGRALRLMQTGSIQTYAFLFILGASLVFYLILF
ncbi:MAG TPA: NADH-quinone oxidoreductase subunit L [Verrucomicrobiales bacterium]|nr:NADH-quinone oxidoreductase subunit L [Verrucomicrobiales bacterium]